MFFVNLLYFFLLMAYLLGFINVLNKDTKNPTMQIIEMGLLVTLKLNLFN